MAKTTQTVEPVEADNSKIFEQAVDEVMHNSMIPYSEYVILDRALPRVEDGLKPVQRRIIYTLHELGITADKPYKKCARIVGDCLGKYHPHGDSSVYDALVRMAQGFVINAPLVDGHGNFGSVDGDSAAAMRYTEARMSVLAQELLKDLEKDTVNWSLNFDDSLKEPDTLPSKYCNLLVNGASGIAVGLATNIPPHNLGEVIDGTIAYIDNPRITLEDMMKIIPAPDFPTGGVLFVNEEMTNAYRTGKGRVVMRARINIEKIENDKKNIVITELPYQVNKAQLLQSIDALVEKMKDDDKNSPLSYVSDIVDESDRRGMRAVIKLKRGADVQTILNILYNKTKLQDRFSLNMVAIAGGKPRQMGLLDIIKYYVEYQRTVVYRRTQYEVKQAKERAEILEGLLIAIDRIDDIIKILKNADNTTDAKAQLKAAFGFTEKQVQAILEMRLGRLVKLEANKLQQELNELRILIDKLNAILGSRKLQYDVIKVEMKEIKRKYKKPRQSTIMDGGNGKTPALSVADTSEIIREGILVLDVNNNIKCVSERSYAAAMKSDSPLIAQDLVRQTIKYTSDMNIYAFTNYGNCVRIYLSNYDLRKWRDKGDKLNTITADCKKDEVIIKLFAFKDEPTGELYFYNASGNVKKTAWSEYNLSKDYYQAIKLDENDRLVGVEQVEEDKTILFVTEQGMWLNAATGDIPLQGRMSQGVIGIILQEGDKVMSAMQIEQNNNLVLVTDKGYAKRLFLTSLDVSKRYRKGGKLFDLLGVNGSRLIYARQFSEEFQLRFKLEEEGALAVSTEKISLETKVSKGKIISGLRGVKIIDVV